MKAISVLIFSLGAGLILFFVYQIGVANGVSQERYLKQDNWVAEKRLSLEEGRIEGTEDCNAAQQTLKRYEAPY